MKNSTRTMIDLILLDVLSHIDKDRPSIDQKMSCWSEISVSFKSGGEKLHGRGEYLLGYSPTDVALDSLHTLLLAGEANKVVGAERPIWQIVGYCGMLHMVINPSVDSTVYGFITDSAIWEFVRVDNAGKIFTSDPLTNLSDVETWLGYLIESARKSMPTASPPVSPEDLSNFEINVERYTTGQPHGLAGEDDDDDEAAAKAFEDMYQKNLEEATKQNGGGVSNRY
ncbi:hypothetical protein BC832DRAFT_566393 [Gaertneriomyces semiglobifer]|nr:hypothetical protein BC832DRAFT_566393 [Gaertneriomyces semiglobifer]